MAIVDAQIHLWGSGLPVNDAHRQVTRFDAEEAVGMMDEGGVDAAVIHPPGWDPGSCDMAEKAIADYPGRFAMMTSPKLDDPATPGRIATVRDEPGVLGLRYVFMGEEGMAAMRDGRHDWLWTAAEAHGVPVAVLATDTLPDFAEVAARHPGLKLTIDHLGGRGGFTRLKDHAAMTHLPELIKLARLPNVAVKATGLPGYSGQEWPFPIMQDYLKTVLDAFGPERVFWGTDITKMPCPWADCISMFTSMLDGEAERLVMGDAFCRWWGWAR
ncbi:MAG: amidohydrolase family protein [Minwuia sp.]|uniref:amidohydrolase family protein n=1 Tax=Minwuia sp. TaxID=2493630 RepID=UPI003A897725